VITPRKAGPSLSREVLGARLRAEREARGWTFRKVAEKLSDASSGICDVPDVESIIPQIRRWERGASGISEHYRTLYCLVFEVNLELFAISPGTSVTDSVQVLANDSDTDGTHDRRRDERQPH
jgi:transcriptional regulator with XRE-family HTH domain